MKASRSSSWVSCSFLTRRRPTGEGTCRVALIERFLGQFVGHQQLQPVDQLGGGGLLLEARRLAQLEEHLQGLADEAWRDLGEVHVDDGLHRLLVGKVDVMEKAATQEGVGQFLFVVGGDHDHWAMTGTNGLAGFIDMEFHAVEFLEQIVGKLDVGLVNLVDQQNHPLVTGEGLPQLAGTQVVGHVLHALDTQLRIPQPADGVVFIEPLGCLVVDLMCQVIRRVSSDAASSSASSVLPVPGSPLISRGRCRVTAALTACFRASVAT